MPASNGADRRQVRPVNVHRPRIPGRRPLPVVAGFAVVLLLGIPIAVDHAMRPSKDDASPASEAFWINHWTAEPTESVSFVGEVRAIVEVRRPPEERRSNFYRELRVRFAVVEVVYGSYDRPEIDLEFYMHGDGLPRFVRDPVLLVQANRYGDRWVQEREPPILLHSTASGALAGCGDPIQRFAGGIGRPVWPSHVDFDPPVVFDLKAESWAALEREYGRGSLRRVGDRALCVAGASPAEIVLARRHAHLARGLRID